MVFPPKGIDERKYQSIKVKGKLMSMELPPYMCGEPFRKFDGKTYHKGDVSNSKKILADNAKGDPNTIGYRIVRAPKTCGAKYVCYRIDKRDKRGVAVGTYIPYSEKKMKSVKKKGK